MIRVQTGKLNLVSDGNGQRGEAEETGASSPKTRLVSSPEVDAPAARIFPSGWVPDVARAVKSVVSRSPDFFFPGNAEGSPASLSVESFYLRHREQFKMRRKKQGFHR